MTAGFKSGTSKHDPGHEKPWYAPKWADTLTNDNLKDINYIKEGKELYHANCLVCHGPGGRGDGDSGFGLEVPAGDFTDEFTVNESDGSLFWKISNGKGPMPGFQSRINETQRWQLVAFIRDLQIAFQLKKNKSVQWHKQ